jgi:membrane-bound ClpP family serine protease
MLLVLAVLLAIFAVLPSPWNLVLIIAGAAIETSQTGFWMWWTKRKPPTAGAEAMIGARAEVVSECRPEGWVRVQGELWQARCDRGAAVGESVRIKAIHGLTLIAE